MLLDSDTGHLRTMKNAAALSPLDLSRATEYEDYLVTIWDRVRQGNVKKIREYTLKKSNGQQMYLVNAQTY